MKIEPWVEEKFNLFVFTIIELESVLISLHDLNDSPYNEAGKIFPRQGKFLYNGKSVEYKFHGGGCCFVLDGIAYEYDIQSSKPNNIIVSPWKFSRYLNAFGTSIFDEAEVIYYLKRIEKKVS